MPAGTVGGLRAAWSLDGVNRERSAADMQLIVSVPRQELHLEDGQGTGLRRFRISTSRFGTGSEAGSNRTPLGRFRIAQKIGHGAPPGTIFQSRAVSGIWDGQPSAEDFVLTRILWLEGMEPENASTFSRYIYIHGTNQENLLGTAASHGCIRMSNADVMELFDLVYPGTEVTIGDMPSGPSGDLREFV